MRQQPAQRVSDQNDLGESVGVGFIGGISFANTDNASVRVPIDAFIKCLPIIGGMLLQSTGENISVASHKGMEFE